MYRPRGKEYASLHSYICWSRPVASPGARQAGGVAGQAGGKMLWSMMMWPGVASRSSSEPNPKSLLMPLAEV